jgi:hypothetical protein
MKRPIPAVIRLVRHGVWLHDVPAPHLPLGFVAVIRDDLLVTDLSGDKVVQDEHHARCVRLAEALATAVAGALVGPAEVAMRRRWRSGWTRCGSSGRRRCSRARRSGR